MNINATILGQAIAFILFVAFCMKYVWPPIMAAIENRQKKVANDLASAERAKKDLDLARTNATELLQTAKDKAQMLIEQANQRCIQILEEAKAEAEKERSKIITQAYAQIDTEIKRTREELRKQVAILAIVGAEKIIEHSVDKAANNEIIYKVVADL